MKNSSKQRLKNYLSKEIMIEYKSCIYFFYILFLYCMHLITEGIYQAQILHMFEIIMTTYTMGYLQVYAFHNFDEAESVGGREAAEILLCTCLYTVLSYLFCWFDRNVAVTAIFFVCILFGYLCMYLANKIKRNIDTEKLNEMLTEYKRGE